MKRKGHPHEFEFQPNCSVCLCFTALNHGCSRFPPPLGKCENKDPAPLSEVIDFCSTGKEVPWVESIHLIGEEEMARPLRIENYEALIMPGWEGNEQKEMFPNIRSKCIKPLKGHLGLRLCRFPPPQKLKTTKPPTG